MRKPLVVACMIAFATGGIAGCASKVQLAYEPSNEVTGSGEVGIRGFVYAPAEAGRVKPNQSQVAGVLRQGDTYTEDVVQYVERALQLELETSGFRVSGVAERSVTGRIEAFGLDHSPKGNRIDAIVQVNFQVQRGSQVEFEYLSTAAKEYRSVVGGTSSGDMMMELTRLCIAQFLAKARDANQI